MKRADVSPYADTVPPSAPTWPRCVDCGLDIEAGFSLCLACVDERRIGDTVDQYLDEVACGVIDEKRQAEAEAAEWL